MPRLLLALVLAVTSAGCAVSQPRVVPQPRAASPNCRANPVSDPGLTPPAVGWLGPDVPRDREKLDAWCAAVGPPVVIRRHDEPPPAGRILVASWNAAAGAGDLHAFLSALRTGEFSGGAPVAHYIVLLQEVTRSGNEVPEVIPANAVVPGRIGMARAGGDIRRIAGAFDLDLFYAPAMRNGPGREDRGNAILSTLPLEDTAVLELPFERQRRVAVLATVAGRNRQGAVWRVRVASLHLETRAGLTRGGPAAARRRQAQAVIEALSPSPLPVVVGGDLNTSWGDDEPAVRDLRRAFDDADAERGITWDGRFGISARLDHLFARLPEGRLQVRRVRDRFGSDHHPLVGEINVNRGI